MANGNFNTALASLHCAKDRTELMSALLIVRRYMIWPKDIEYIRKLQSSGGLKRVFKIYLMANKKLLDVSLSILANCCLDISCATELVLQLNIFAVATRLVKTYISEDSVIGRVYRLLGNICSLRQCWAGSILERHPDLVVQAIKISKNVNNCNTSPSDAIAVTSDATNAVVIRFLRYLLSKGNFNHLVTGVDILNGIGCMLFKYTQPDCADNVKKKNVQFEIIKFLEECSRIRSDLTIPHLRNCAEGDSLICLSDMFFLSPKRITLILINFMGICRHKSDLPITKIFEKSARYFNETSIKVWNQHIEQMLQSICYLLYYPSNRVSKNRIILPALIHILNELDVNENHKLACNMLIIMTLSHFKYDNGALRIQINARILSILKSKLMIISENKSLEDLIAESMPSTAGCNPNTEGTSSRPKVIAVEKTSRWINSAASTVRINESVNSNLLEMHSHLCTSYDSTEEMYSPLCSESEADDDIDSADDVLSISSLDHESTSPFAFTNLTVKDLKARLIVEIVQLLRIYLKLKPSIAQLGDSDLLQIVLTSATYIDDLEGLQLSIFVNFYRCALQHYEFYLPLLTTDYVPRLYNLLSLQKYDWCSKCSPVFWLANFTLLQITKFVESKAGSGDIAHQLLKADSIIKCHIATTIPYVIEKNKILERLMIDCKGLDILTESCVGFSNEQKERDDGLKALQVLTLRFLSNKFLPIRSSSETVECTKEMEMDVDESENEVVFEMDDNSLVSANRDMLVEVSDYFTAMLVGNFKEASQNVIKLSAVNTNAFKELIKLLTHKRHSKLPSNIEADLEVHLEMLKLCDHFLLGNMWKYLMHTLKVRMTIDNVNYIYRWCVESLLCSQDAISLRNQCVIFTLITNTSTTRKQKLFSDLCAAGHLTDFLMCIKEMLQQLKTDS